MTQQTIIVVQVLAKQMCKDVVKWGNMRKFTNMAVVVLNNGVRINSKFHFKEKYTFQERRDFMRKYALYLAKSYRKGWENVHDYYCILLVDVLSRSTELKEKHGQHLYLMQNGKGLTKIGRSSKPFNRCDEVEIESGFNVRILAVFDNAGKDEKEWHNRFLGSNKRFKGIFGRTCTEWFELSEDDLSTIFNSYGTKRQ